MKKEIALALFFLTLVQPCFGCISGQSVEMADGKKIEFNAGVFLAKNNPNKDPKSVSAKLKATQGLSDEDIGTLTDLVVRGLSAAEQTDAQYSQLMKQLKQSPVDCRPMGKIERVGRWTAYTKTGKKWSDRGCLQAKCL